MTDTMTVSALIAELRMITENAPLYKVRAFDKDGNRLVSFRVNGERIDLTEETYADAEDVDARLVPKIIERNKSASRIVTRLEAYHERQDGTTLDVASMELKVTPPTSYTQTEKGEWKPE